MVIVSLGCLFLVFYSRFGTFQIIVFYKARTFSANIQLISKHNKQSTAWLARLIGQIIHALIRLRNKSDNCCPSLFCYTLLIVIHFFITVFCVTFFDLCAIDTVF